MRPLPLGAALRRGAFLTAANWPVVLIDFLIESFYKLALAVPVLGGALAAAAILDTDVAPVIDDGVRSAADAVVGALAATPSALLSFFAALAFVAFGGGLIMFVLKSGTLAVLAAAEQKDGDIEAHPLRLDRLRRASRFSLDAFVAGVRRFGGRVLVLAIAYGAGSLLVGVLYLGVLGYGFSLAVRWTWMPAWPLLVIAATTIAVVAFVAGGLAFDLLRVAVVVDDCTVGTAVARMRRFVTEDARQVIGIFTVLSTVVIVATIASLVAAAGLAVMAWAPIVGLVIVPLQIVAWLARGLVFQYVSLTALAAYQAQYRRFSRTRWPPALSATVPGQTA